MSAICAEQARYRAETANACELLFGVYLALPLLMLGAGGAVPRDLKYICAELVGVVLLHLARLLGSL